MKRFLITLMLFSIVAPAFLIAGSPRMVLVEEYTSAYCGACVARNPAFNATLKKNLSKVIPMIIHTGNSPGDPMYKHEPSNSGRVLTYLSGSYGTPSAWANGTKVELENVEGEIYKYKSQISPLTINVVEQRTQNTIEVGVYVHSDDLINGNKQLYIAVIEDELHYNIPGSSETDFYWTCRKIYPSSYPGNGFAYTSKANETKAFKASIPISPEWDMSKIYCIAFVQDMESAKKEVLQVAKTMDPSLAKPEITLNPASTINFGQCSGLTIKNMSITNTGFMDLDISKVQITGDADGVFSVEKAPSKVTPFEKSDFTVKFFPLDNKAYSASLEFTSNASNGTLKKINLTGTGIGITPGPKLLSQTEALDFGDVSSDKTLSFTIQNIGTQPLIITGMNITGEGASAFTLESNPTLTLDPLGKEDVSIKFTPTDNLTYSAMISILSNNMGQPEVKVSLTGRGEGFASVPKLTASVNTLDFGNVSYDELKSLKIRNEGGGTLDVTELLIQGADKSCFTLETYAPMTLQPGREEVISIRFTPYQNRTFSASLRIISNDPVYSPMDIILSGIGEGIEEGVNEPSTGFNFSIDASHISQGYLDMNLGSADPVRIAITIYDVTGRVVAAIPGNIYSPGSQTVKLGSAVPLSGMYYLVADVGGRVFTKLLPVIK